MVWPHVIFIALFIITSNLVNGFDKMTINQRPPQKDEGNLKLSGYSKDSKEYRLEQPLDHFDSNENRTFNMTYYEILNFWQPDGPIYIYLEPKLRYYIKMFPIDYRGTFMRNITEDTNGVMFAVNCRYYGNNPRLPERSLTEYYKFLSSEQELADLARIIKDIKSDPKYESSKVVVIGYGPGSGNLAAWSRARYPELVDAALAASAPMQAKKDFHEYYEGVRYTFEKYGTENCVEKISNRQKRYAELLKTEEGTEIFKKEFNVCPEVDFTSLKNIQFFFQFYIYVFGLSFYAQETTPALTKHRCEFKDDKIWPDQLNFTNKIEIPSQPEKYCWSLNFDYMDFIQPLWYQCCTEFGYFQTTSSEKLPFVHWQPMEYFGDICQNVFGPDIAKKMDDGVARTNEMFGGAKPNVTRVVFTHGDMDPWHRLGVLEDLGPDAPVLIANGTSHAAIIYPSYYEPKELTDQIKRVKELIKEWISEP